MVDGVVFNRLRNKLQDLIQRPSLEASGGSPAPAVNKKREPAPVIVYFERERNQHVLERVTELLSSRNIAFRTLDVRGDAPTIAFITREAKCSDDDLPIVFIAGTPVGGYEELVAWDTSGKLATSVFGA